MIRLRGIDKPRWLLTVNRLLEVHMEERVFDIKLTNGPITGNSNIKNNSDCSRLHHRNESLIIIDTRLLRVSTNNPPSLVMSERTIGVKFVLEYPIARNDISTRRSRHKFPSLVVNKSLEFIRHSHSPIRISKSTPIVARDG
uniref:Uncharacterized protein n=1 Tax=Arundo donax TaxID=35708 RepID=A0A0A9DAU1_ARUDO